MGSYLSELRVYYGLSPEEVAKRLRFRPHYIRAIEAGDVAKLPGKVYARGYVYKYAEFLGLNGAETIEAYQELSAAQPAANDFVLSPEETEQMRPKRWALWAPLAIIAALFIGLLILSGAEGTGRFVPVADAILSNTTPATTDLIVRPTAHACGDVVNSALPCWQLSVQNPQHGFSPRTPQSFSLGSLAK